MPTARSKKFGIELIQFYKEFLLGTSKAVELLAKIEKKYPTEYRVMKELKDDPKAIAKLSTDLPDDVKTVFFSIVMESSMLGERMNKLFDLDKKAKEQLSKDIKGFAERVEKEIGELIEEHSKP